MVEKHYIKLYFSYSLIWFLLPESVLYINIGTGIDNFGCSKFDIKTYNLPKTINNISIYKRKNGRVHKYVIKNNFIEQLNELVEKR